MSTDYSAVRYNAVKFLQNIPKGYPIARPSVWGMGCLFLHGLTLIPAWIINHMLSETWDEITYPFINFNGCTVEVSEWISKFIPHFIMEIILGLKLNHVSKRAPWCLLLMGVSIMRNLEIIYRLIAESHCSHKKLLLGISCKVKRVWPCHPWILLI